MNPQPHTVQSLTAAYLAVKPIVVSGHRRVDELTAEEMAGCLLVIGGTPERALAIFNARRVHTPETGAILKALLPSA